MLPPTRDSDFTTVHFERVLGVPGVEHALHAAVKHTCRSMPQFADWLKRAKAVSKMFTSKMYREHLKVQLLSTDVLTCSSHTVFDNKFRRLLEHRFLSVQQFTSDILVFEDALCGRFRVAQVFNSRKQIDNDWLDPTLISQALNDARWWLYTQK